MNKLHFEEKSTTDIVSALTEALKRQKEIADCDHDFLEDWNTGLMLCPKCSTWKRKGNSDD